MTSVKDPRGVVVFTAKYKGTGELEQLKDAYGKDANISRSSFSGSTAAQSVKDLDGNQTEMIYNHRGDVVREIREVRSAAGAVEK